jgi:hypothetical protein
MPVIYRLRPMLYQTLGQHASPKMTMTQEMLTQCDGRAVTSGIDSLTLDFHHRQQGCYAVHG